MKTKEYVYFEANNIHIDETFALIETRCAKGFDACVALLAQLLFGLYCCCFRSYAEGTGRVMKTCGGQRPKPTGTDRKKAYTMSRDPGETFTANGGILDKIRLDKNISTTTVVVKERPEAGAVAAGKERFQVSGEGQTSRSAKCGCRVASRRRLHPVSEKLSPPPDEGFTAVG